MWGELYSGISIGEILINNSYSNFSFNLKRKINIFGDPSIILTYDFLSNIDNHYHLIEAEYLLSQNYPNPFNPTTIINYSLKKEGFTTLKIYDILGSEITTLVSENKFAGSYTIEFDGSNLSNGVYFYTINSGNFHQTKKMILIK
ncbi:MAG: T9SS type A sorting domain-containing protein [Ignavibacteriae bacterium]|nr:T9SS type A sorting domain-containing protein [Ignavibacteriota bacterium]